MTIEPKNAADRRADLILPIIGFACVACIGLSVFVAFHFIVKFW